MKISHLLFIAFIIVMSFYLNACSDKKKDVDQSKIDVANEIQDLVLNKEVVTKDTLEHDSEAYLSKKWDIKEDSFAFKVETLEYIEFDEREKVKKVTNYPKVKRMLENVVVFNDQDYKSPEDAVGVKSIHFRNGEIAGDVPDDIHFIAYYPNEDVLLLQTPDYVLDVAYNLSTGEGTQRTGNPEYCFTSDDKQFRLNGYVNSNDCINYFIQKKVGRKYVTIIPLSDVFAEKSEFRFCQIKNAFWANNNETLYIEETYFDSPSNSYRITINDYLVRGDSIPARFFTSKLRPNEEIKHDQNYTDTVKYLSYNTDYDYAFMSVTKNGVAIDIIFYADFELFNQLKPEEDLVIIWEKKKIVHAGDTEILDYRDYLVSFKRLGDNSLNTISDKKGSFVISCGSGCAMTYTEDKIEVKYGVKELTFKVMMYTNDRLMDSYFQTYSYACDTLNDTQILLNGDSTFRVKDQHVDVQNMLKSYVPQLCD